MRDPERKAHRDATRRRPDGGRDEAGLGPGAAATAVLHLQTREVCLSDASSIIRGASRKEIPD